MSSQRNAPSGPDAAASGPEGASNPAPDAILPDVALPAPAEPVAAGSEPFTPKSPTRRRGTVRPQVSTGLGLGMAVLFLSLLVLIPLAAVVLESSKSGSHYFWASINNPNAWAALKLTLELSLLVALINLVMGTVIAWVLVRDKFPGKGVVDMLIDLPFALPTIVAGLVLLALYGVSSPLHVNLAYARSGVLVALLFVTLPFVVRTVQPVLLEFDRDMEQAAHSLGASQWTTFRRIVLPNLLPAMISGAGLAFTRAIAEYGSTSLISGNLPGQTEVAAVNIFGHIQSDDTVGAAAISTFLLGTALVMLLILEIVQRWRARRG